MEKDIVNTAIRKTEAFALGILQEFKNLLENGDLDVYDYLASDIDKLADSIKRKELELWET